MASSKADAPALDLDPMAKAIADVPTIGADTSEPKADEKPKRTRKSRAGASADKAPRTPGRKPNLAPQLQNTIAGIGMIVGTVGNPADGQAIIMGAEAQAVALQHLAEQNDTVRRVLTAMVETSAWGEVLTAFMPTVFAIMGNHGVNPLAALAPRPSVPSTPSTSTTADAAA